MTDLKKDLFENTANAAGDAILAVQNMPKMLSNPLLLDMSDFEKATLQLAGIKSIQEESTRIAEALHCLYRMVGGFLQIKEGELEALDELRARGLKSADEISQRLAQLEKPDEGQGEADGASQRFRDGIRRSIAALFEKSVNSGNGCFETEKGGYYIAFHQKSASTDTEMKFSVNTAVSAWVAERGGQIFLVGKEGIAARFDATDLEAHEKPGRWELFLTVQEGEPVKIHGNKRAFELGFEKVSLNAV